MAAGDPRGLEAAYRRYADRLYAYCRSLLKDADAALDAVHDTFLIASQHAGDLRDPARLQSWLYTIARRECLRALRARKRGAPLPEDDEPAAEPVNPTRALEAEQVRELVASAVAGLNEGDREVIELAVRHELSAAEVGTVLGVSPSHAHARLSRARMQLHRALGALLLARSGGRRCPALAELTRGWNGSFTPLLRKRVSRHVEKCAVCTESQQELLDPAKLLPAYAALPFLPAPELLWSRLEASASAMGAGPGGAPPGQAQPAQTPAGQAPPAQAPPGRAPSGQAPPPTLVMPAVPGTLPASPVHGPPPPQPVAAPDRRLPVVAAAASLALLVLLLGAGGLWLTGAFDPAPAAAPYGPEPGLGVAGSPTASATASPTGEPPAASTAAPTTTAPPATAPPSTTTSAPTPIAFSITAAVDFDCTLGTLYRVSVTAESTVELAAAQLHWTAPAPHQVDMTLSGPRSAEGKTGLIIILEPAVTWWVVAHAADGRETQTEPVAVTDPCP